jgi:YYY domain-containing protein
MIQILGLAALPLTRRVFARLPGQGYAFSKGVGLLLAAYLLWIGASLGLLVNDAGGAVLALLLAAGLSALAGWRDLRGPRLAAFWREEKASILTAEGLFLLAFAGWTAVRAFAPDKILPAGGEKFMEIAFLNGVLNSPSFPPLDPWMAGFGISYYYFGYVMMGLMTRLTAVLPTIGFDLYDALLMGLVCQAAYGVVSSMVRAAGGAASAGWASGLLGAVLVAWMGNLQGLMEGLYSARALPAAFWAWLDIPDFGSGPASGAFYPGEGWWWWRASRVLRDLDLSGQPVLYPPIDEFPFFSFLLGDNHPHKLALPFTLLAIALALNLLLKSASSGAEDRPRVEWSVLSFYALALGSLAFLNTWDFPVFLGLAAAAYGYGAWLRGGPFAMRRALTRTVGLGFGMGIGAVLLYLPFYLSFASQAGGVLPHVFRPTRLAQYLVMFGPFVVILVGFLLQAGRQAGWGRAARAALLVMGVSAGAYLLALLAGGLLITFTPLGGDPTLRKWIAGDSVGVWILGIVRARLEDPWLFLLLSGLLGLALAALACRPRLDEPHDGTPAGGLPLAARFAVLLALAGLGLTLVVEFFYLRDLFGMRMNTIFKVYFQAWVLLGCASAFGVWWVLRFARGVGWAVFAATATLAVAAGLVYPVMAVPSRAAGFRGPPVLDAAASFSGEIPHHWTARPDDWAAIRWLQENASAPVPPVILEAGAGGYEIAGRVSAFTGFPTLLGWTNHEGQWRGSQAEINRREPVIQEIYTTPSAERALELLREWKVQYVVLGEAERAYISRLCQEPQRSCSLARAEAKFLSALDGVFTQGGVTIYRVPRLPGAP